MVVVVVATVVVIVNGAAATVAVAAGTGNFEVQKDCAAGRGEMSDA